VLRTPEASTMPGTSRTEETSTTEGVLEAMGAMGRLKSFLMESSMLVSPTTMRGMSRSKKVRQTSSDVRRITKQEASDQSSALLLYTLWKPKTSDSQHPPFYFKLWENRRHRTAVRTRSKVPAESNLHRVSNKVSTTIVAVAFTIKG
jgi:hypothetical protein